MSPQSSDDGSMPANLPLRNDLIGETPYGAPQLDLPVRLNVNENPYGLDEQVVRDIAERVRRIAAGLNRYPDREHRQLRRAFSDYLWKESATRLSIEQLWAANGSNEIMLQLFQAFGGPGRVALGAAPTYSMYPEYARDTFTNWKVVGRRGDFTLDIQATMDAIQRLQPAIVLLTNPNNPTGTPLPFGDLKAIVQCCAQAGVSGAASRVHPVVVVDEAYVEFRSPGTPSTVSLIEHYPHLAVSRTMSKAFAFAGARVGYLAASKGIIDCLRIVRMPYHLSAVTQAAALAALEHTDKQLGQVGRIRQTRDEMAVWLTQQSYRGKPLEVADSQANFLLFGGHFDDREKVFDLLCQCGVLIRVVGPEGWLRFSMGAEEEMVQLRQALVHTLAELE